MNQLLIPVSIPVSNPRLSREVRASYLPIWLPSVLRIHPGCESFGFMIKLWPQTVQGSVSFIYYVKLDSVVTLKELRVSCLRFREVLCLLMGFGTLSSSFFLFLYRNTQRRRGRILSLIRLLISGKLF